MLLLLRTLGEQAPSGSGGGVEVGRVEVGPLGSEEREVGEERKS